MKKIVLALMSVLLVSCDKLPFQQQQAAAPAQQVARPVDPVTQRANLLADISGVWTNHDGDMVTVDYRANVIRLVVGDITKTVKLGEVDVVHSTVNLLVKPEADSADVIWTLHRLSNAGSTNPQVTLNAGTARADNLTFVRKITNDDVTRLTRLYTEQANRPAEEAEESNSSSHDAHVTTRRHTPSRNVIDHVQHNNGSSGSSDRNLTDHVQRNNGSSGSSDRNLTDHVQRNNGSSSGDGRNLTDHVQRNNGSSSGDGRNLTDHVQRNTY
jgi:hypothetical protein